MSEISAVILAIAAMIITLFGPGETIRMIPKGPTRTTLVVLFAICQTLAVFTWAVCLSWLIINAQGSL